MTSKRRGIFRCSLELALAVAVLLPTASAIKDPEDVSYTYDMEKVYDVVLKRWRTSAKGIVEKGMESAEWLAKTPKPPKGEDARTPTKERAQWIWKANPYGSMFVANGGDMDKKWETEVKKLTYIAEQYEAVLKAHQADKSTEKPKFQFRCGDDFFVFLKADAPDPRADDHHDSHQYTLAKPVPGERAYPDGAWYATTLAKGQHWFKEYPPTHRGVICPQPGEINYSGRMQYFEAYAQAKHQFGVLVICPLVLEPELYDQDGRPGVKRHSWDWNIDELAKKMAERTPIDSLAKTLASILVHEWFHMVLGWPDPFAVNEAGKDVTSINKAHSNDSIKKNNYGWPSSHFLALFRPDVALKQSPENYKLFAVTQYLDMWFWGNGVAKKNLAAYDTKRSVSLTLA